MNLHDLPKQWRADPHANAEGCTQHLERALAEHADMIRATRANLEQIVLNYDPRFFRAGAWAQEILSRIPVS